MRRKAAGFTGLATLLAGVMLSATPATAHTSLIGSTPEDGAVLSEAPTEVVLEFDEEVQPDFSQVAVLDGEENHYEDGEPEASGASLTQAVTELPAGDYSISYRVGSADGHPVTGVISFTVGPEGGAAAEDESGTDEGAAADGVAGTAADEDGTPTATVVAAMAAVAGIGIVGVLLLRRRQDATSDDSPPGGR